MLFTKIILASMLSMASVSAFANSNAHCPLQDKSSRHEKAENYKKTADLALGISSAEKNQRARSVKSTGG